MSSAAELPPADYEPRDASSKNILLVAAGLALGLAVCLGLAATLFTAPDRAPAPTGVIGRQTSFHLSADAKSDIAADWLRLDRETKTHLDTYGWIDRDRGIVRIPIDRAMDLLAAEAKKPEPPKGAAK
jgi:hypothetical protein